MATEVGRSYVTMVTKGYSTGEWGGCNPKKPNATANFKYGTGFFGLHPPSVDGEGGGDNHFFVFFVFFV